MNAPFHAADEWHWEPPVIPDVWMKFSVTFADGEAVSRVPSIHTPLVRGMCAGEPSPDGGALIVTGLHRGGSEHRG